MNQYKVVHIGCGGISKAWLAPLMTHKEINIVGLVDLNLDVAIQRKKEFNLQCQTFSDYKKAITTLRPDIVIDNTIPSMHHKIASFALENGCHVFGEKPLADTMDHAQYVVNIANQCNQFYSVMQNRRYLSKIADFQSLINKGSIGKLGYLNAEFYIEAHFGGFREVMDSPLLLDMAIHSFDQARYISGCDPVSCYCQEYHMPGSWYKGAASAVCIFEMTDNVIFSYNGSWAPKGLLTSWECNWKAYGSKASAAWDGINAPYYEQVHKDDADNLFPSHYEKVIVTSKSMSLEKHAACIDDMIDSIKNNLPSKTDCNDNIKSLAMVMAARKSSLEGRKVLISEWFQSK